jgi:hypothetical protein
LFLIIYLLVVTKLSKIFFFFQRNKKKDLYVKIMQKVTEYNTLEETGDMGYYTSSPGSVGATATYSSNLPSGQGGGYQESCSGCYMEGSTLSCMCNLPSGEPNSFTSVSNVNNNSYITNCNGYLKTMSNTSGLPSGNGGGYQSSCSGCTYGTVCGKGVLSCTSCSNDYGDSQASTISNVNGGSVISNCNGNLTNGHC